MEGRFSDPVLHLVSTLQIPAPRWRKPVLIALFGLPCTGKTEVARYLASRLPLTVLSTDEIRLRYGLVSGPATHAVIAKVASRLLSKNVALVWDGIHLARANRDQVRDFARAYDAHLELIYTVAEEKVIRQRLDARTRDVDQTRREGKFVITSEHFARIASFVEPPELNEVVLTVDTTNGKITPQTEPLVRRVEALLIDA